MTDHREHTAGTEDLANYYHPQPIDTLAFFMTSVCPLHCDHCAVDAGNEPESVQPDWESINAWFKDINDSHLISQVNITGGEPFAVFDRLKRLVEIISNNGLEVTVNSSGYWATDPGKAGRQLEPLAQKGLKTLYLSISDYHRQQVPVDNVLLAIDEASNLGISIGILYQYHGDKDRQSVFNEIKEILGADKAKKVRYLNAGPILAMGRASGRFEPGLFQANDRNRYCQNISPTLHLNGDFNACCGDRLPVDSPLRLGNLKAHPFKHLMNRLRCSLYLPFMAFIGLDETIRYLRENEIALPELDQIPRHEMCGCCQAILKNPAVTRFLEGDIPALYRQEMNLKQIILYGRNVFPGDTDAND